MLFDVVGAGVAVLREHGGCDIHIELLGRWDIVIEGILGPVLLLSPNHKNNDAGNLIKKKR